jgi:hypothetical protein
MASKVFLQKWRLFFFSLKMAYKAAEYEKINADVSRIYMGLVAVSDLAYRACLAGRQAEFLKNLENLSSDEFLDVLVKHSLERRNK